MADHTDLIKSLRRSYMLEILNWDLLNEAADALEAAQAEIERLTTDRRVLQADGKHPAPCAKFCEATAFTIERRRVRAERDKALARIAELTKQEPVAEMALVDMGIGDARQLRVNWLMDGYLDVGAKLFAAAGASPVQPSQTGDAKDVARYRWLREYLPSDDLQYDDNLVLAKTGEDIDAAIDAAINAKETDRG